MSKHDLIAKGYEEGRSAGYKDKARSANPYAPHTQQEKWEAWQCGYDFAQLKYTVAKTPATSGE